MGKFLVKKKEERWAMLKEACAVFHKENSGFIKCEDVETVLRSNRDNPTDAEVKHVIGVLDVDKNGVVEFSKFLNFLVLTMKDDNPEEDLKTVLTMISAAEFSDASADHWEAVTDEKENSMAKRARLDGEGKVSYEDFKKM